MVHLKVTIPDMTPPASPRRHLGKLTGAHKIRKVKADLVIPGFETRSSYIA